MKILTCLLLSLLLFGCASTPPDEADNDQFVFEEPFLPEIDKGKSKSIFVFIDETGNNRKVPTNIYRLFQVLVRGNNDKQTIADYIEGVGNSDTPMKGQPFGFGIDDRILLGYSFIMQHYRPRDKIYLFGFGRGAYAARSLAGMLAYSGILKVSDEERKDKKALITISTQLLELTKSVRDSSFVADWQHWQPHIDKPLLADRIHGETINEKDERVVEPADIQFLGLWDTIPASSANGKLLTIVTGAPYKIDSYPVIHQIAHAVSTDEKRAMFKPIFLSPAINPTFTELNETAFAGSHADIGGGYDDLNNDLPNLSLNWMLDLLSKNYHFTKPIKDQYKANIKGLAHLSVSEFEGNADSDCQDRVLPESVNLHASIAERKNAGAVPLRICAAVESGMDGKSCKRNSNVDGMYQTEKAKQDDINCDTIKQQKWMAE